VSDYLVLVLGIIAAGIGGELFVRGVVGLAHWARVSPGIIGATVAAFATSSPELSISINSALAGKPQISLGDALGSNVVNIALILALALLVSGIQTPRDTLRRDFPIAFLIPIVTGVLFLNGELSRWEGVLMFMLFLAWVLVAGIEAQKQRSSAEEILGEHSRWGAVLTSVSGLVFLIAAGNLIVMGAKGIAISFGIDEFIIGATIVAVGTSMPELATISIAKLRGHEEVGLGTILGSNIYNGLFIISIAAIIHPITVNWREVAVALAFGIMAVIFTYPSRNGLIERKRGVLLLVLYAIYLTVTLYRR